MKIEEISGMGVFYPKGYKREGPNIIFTLQAWRKIRDTVGSRFPETGGLLFSCKDYYFIDTFEFDERGSGKASSVYAPDVIWANRVHEKHMGDLDRFRVLVGVVHSHPGVSYKPSEEAGYGRGDLGYVRKFFDFIPYLEEFLLPIVVFPFNDSFPVLVPWICRRSWRGKVKLTLAREIIVVDASEVPYRVKSERKGSSTEVDKGIAEKASAINEVETTYKTFSREV